jgi:hypothetical protein
VDVSTLPTGAVLTTLQPPEGTITRAADVNTPSTVVVPTNTPQLQDLPTKDVSVTPSNSDVVPTGSQSPKVLTNKVVVVETPNSVAAPTTVPQPKVPISRDAVATPANTVVVRMVPPKQAVTTSKVAKISHRIFKRVVFSRKSAVPVAITRSNGSSTWTTAAVPGSGTADATETTIVSRPKKNATASVLNRREWTDANFRRCRDRAKGTILNGTTTRSESIAPSLSTGVVWVTTIDSRPEKTACRSA